ncbi:hypothetical protein N7462_008876 [Penicillium macrosclerotiorum]|uniref:uncharacterized protein n=1 Tax=Penicillium macrosclerotiorum TaxID=303699 RepID=UPI002549B0CB|nr:uncharacterized protein N7462_008876 [Penicillium macrosclerotiorum]KAJ5675979.1 hypothetical protein N7462_008876 [Penicillium macrosclerotiorum]
MSVPHVAPSHVAPSHDDYGQAKRRKVRKGTHSCWECKRRKMKCRFDPRIESTSCNGCRRRGSSCISQEFPEDLEIVPMSIGTTNSDVTSLDGRTRPGTPCERADRIFTPVSTIMKPSQYYKSLEYSMIVTDGFQQYPPTTRNDTTQFEYERLSLFLYESLPSRADIEIICKASRHCSILSHELLTTPYTTLFQNGLQTPQSLLMTPEPNMNPVLIARHMLQLAIFLQHLPPDLHKKIEGLSEPPRAIMERLVDLAVYHVTTNEALIGSIESLECIMLESLYHVNIGNLRRSWVAGRRAMSLAQLMGFHRPDNQALYKALHPQTKYDSQIMWLRIMTLDRQLCLLLGLPEGFTDHSMASETHIANDCPMGRLERLHCAAMSQILKRNASKLSGEDLAVTRAIDLDLQEAASSLPSKWWLAPKLDNASNGLQAVFWDTRRLVLQICHYNLLTQLHLPYMLRPSSADNKYEYSRIICVNASREVLSRYNLLRSFNRIAYSCRTVDFLALMTAMALLLAHMDSHSDGVENLLANQYLSDRGMIEQVQEHMSEISRLNSDELSAQSADLLKSLLAIDLEKGHGRVSVREAGSEAMLPHDGMLSEEESVVRVHIPYFGVIRIAREKQQAKTSGTTSNSNSEAQLRLSSLKTSPDPLSTGSLSSGPISINSISIDNTPNPLSFPVADTAPPHEFSAPFAHQLQQPCQTTFSDPGLSLTSSSLMQGGHPGLAGGGEDWAFQGVDMVFFENIMRNVGGGF